MSITLRLPPMQERTSAEMELRELKRYLFQLVQELNATLAMIDDGGGTKQAPAAAASQEQIIRRAQGQLAKTFLPRETFDGYFRAGLLDEDSSGKHYGVEIGEQDRSGAFKASARFETDEITIGDITIKKQDGRLTIE